MILEAILHSLIKTRCDVLESNPALLKKTAGGVGGGAAPPPVANTTSFRRVLMGSVSAARMILEASVHSSQKCRGPVGSVCKQKACTLSFEKFLYHNCMCLTQFLLLAQPFPLASTRSLSHALMGSVFAGRKDDASMCLTQFFLMVRCS